MAVLDLQIGASADDGYRATGTTGFVSSTWQNYSGHHTDAAWLDIHGFARWTAATFSGIINVAYVQCYAFLSQGSPLLKVYAVKEDNAAAPTTAAEFDADPLTTAAIDWDGLWITSAFNQSPSLVSVFQELADSYTISNDAVMVQLKNDGATDISDHGWRSYEYDSTKAAKLHIEYTAPVAKTGTDTGAGSDVQLKDRTLASQTESGSGVDVNLKERQFSATDLVAAVEAYLKQRQIISQTDSGEATETATIEKSGTKPLIPDASTTIPRFPEMFSNKTFIVDVAAQLVLEVFASVEAIQTEKPPRQATVRRRLPLTIKAEVVPLVRAEERVATMLMVAATISVAAIVEATATVETELYVRLIEVESTEKLILGGLHTQLIAAYDELLGIL